MILSSPRLRGLGLLAAAGLTLVVGLCSLAIGSLDLPLHAVISALGGNERTEAEAIVRELRLPRTVLGLLVGGALGVAGALMQGVTRNPLAEPGILGINAGAAFAVVLAIWGLGIDSVSAYAWFALLGAAVTAVLAYLLGFTGRAEATPARLALAGAVLAALFASLTSAVLVLDAGTLDQFRFWMVGSIAGRDFGVVRSVAPFIGAGLVLALLSGRRLNALALGDDVAGALGQRVQLARAGIAVGFVLLAGGAVAAAGPIAFVGLVCPHLARALVGADYRWIVPYSALLGAILLLSSDIVGRVVARPGELEVGIVTAVLGAPLFIWFVRRGRLAHA